MAQAEPIPADFSSPRTNQRNADDDLPDWMEDAKARNTSASPKLVIFMVGLPARGKSYISKKLARYLNWLQYDTRVFNAGETRRSEKPPGRVGHSAPFFDPLNVEAVAQREAIALRTLDRLLDWLQNDKACVGILDATNSTTKRRATVLERVRQRKCAQIDVLFLESCCWDPEIIDKNIRLKLSGPDYRHQRKDIALIDFRNRVKLYEKSYVPLGTDVFEVQLPYIKLIDVGKQLIANCISGILSATAAEYLLNFRLHERQIWITRNGESLDDVRGIIGRNSRLSPQGAKFASALNKFLDKQWNMWESQQQGAQFANDDDTTATAPLHRRRVPVRSFNVWTSTMTQAIETGQSFDMDRYRVRHLRMLDDLNAGDMAGLTFADIESSYPEEMAKRRENPVFYRWPGLAGESYADVISRLRPVINELERSEDHVLLITHRAVARVLLSYFQELDWASIANIDVPPGQVFSVELVRDLHGSDPTSLDLTDPCFAAAIRCSRRVLSVQ
jgi:6-phosphofructo-2-kinase